MYIVRALANLILILVSFILQTTVFRALDFGGIAPNLLMIMVTSSAYAAKLGSIPNTITRLSRMPKNRFIFSFIDYLLSPLTSVIRGCYGRRKPF